MNTSKRCRCSTYCEFKRIPTRFKLLLKVQLTLMTAH